MWQDFLNQWPYNKFIILPKAHHVTYVTIDDGIDYSTVENNTADSDMYKLDTHHN